MKRLILATLASGLAIAAAAPANAAIFIGIAFNGGAVTTVATDSGTGRATYSAVLSGYDFDISGNGFPRVPQPTLLTQSLNIQNVGLGGDVVDVYVTQTDLTALPPGLLSSFTSNTVTGVTAQVTSFFSDPNALYGGTQLQTTTFTGPSTFMGSNSVAGSGTFSETVRYRLTFSGASGGNFNGTANLTAVPEPATWGMMIVGFGLMGGVLRRRSTKVAFA